MAIESLVDIHLVRALRDIREGYRMLNILKKSSNRRIKAAAMRLQRQFIDEAETAFRESEKSLERLVSKEEQVRLGLTPAANAAQEIC